MNKFSLTDLNELIRIKEYPSISIFFPTHVTGIDLQQNHLKLKNLLNKCQNKLEAEWTREKVLEFLKPGAGLQNDNFFWSHQSEGLALFISPGFSHYYNLSVAPEEKIVIGNYFNILPLLPVLMRNKKYYILLIRQKGLKFFEANYSNIREVELHDVPLSLEEVLQYDVSEENLQVRMVSSVRTSGTDGVYYGQGDVADGAHRKKHIEIFLKEVAKGIDKQLNGQNIPLVLAGVEYEQAIYRQCSGYKHIIDKGFSNDSGKLDIREIHQSAQKAVQPFFSKEIIESIAVYKNLINTKKTSSDIREILPAAYSGRVNTLLLDVNKSIPGKVDNEFQQIEIFEKEKENSEDLLNLAAVRQGPVSLVSSGPRSSLALLVAAALEEKFIAGVELHGSLGSLKEAIEKNWTFPWKGPEFFCFGLLEEFDIRQIAALVAPRPASFVKPTDKVSGEMAPLSDWYRLLGQTYSADKLFSK